jgi:hypothetical protein
MHLLAVADQANGEKPAIFYITNNAVKLFFLEAKKRLNKRLLNVRTKWLSAHPKVASAVHRR